MALDTYAGLKAAIASRLNRTDLTSSIPDFIRLAEAQIARRLKTRESVVRRTYTIENPTAGVPAGFREAFGFTFTDTKAEIVYLDPARFAEINLDDGRPRFFTVEGSRLRFAPEPDASYSAVLVYSERMEPLEEDADSNWVLENHPDAYLYGALIEAGDHLRDDERIPRWQERFDETIERLNAEGDRPGRSRLRADEAAILSHDRTSYDISRDA